MRFKDFVKLIETALSVPLGISIPAPAFGALPSVWTGSQSADMPLRSGGWAGSNQDFSTADIGIPTVSKTAKIEFINDKTNPMLIYLADKSILYVPYDGFKKIPGDPSVGRMLNVVFQRRPDDNSKNFSQIHSMQAS